MPQTVNQLCVYQFIPPELNLNFPNSVLKDVLKFNPKFSVVYITKAEIEHWIEQNNPNWLAIHILEENNYGYSITNSWEHYKKDNNVVVIEMNFTRFLKDSTVMGAKNRTATYVLRKKNGGFKISALIPHTPVSE